MRQRQRSQAGFSLVELMMAVLILAVGLLGLAELQVTAMKANSQSETSVAATALAQRVIEDIVRRKPSDDIFKTAVTNATWGPTLAVEGAGSYDITYSVNLNYEGVPKLCRVTVTVASTSAVMSVLGNRVRTVTASTLKRAA